jgi:hypothetical protein
MSPFTSPRLHDRMRFAMQLTIALLLVTACRGPSQSPVPGPSPLQRLADQPLDQPPHTTDSVWAVVTAPENVIDDGEGGRWVRNALYVGFVDGVPLARRQQLVDSIQGRAVGGTTLGSTPLHLLVFEHLRPAPRDVAFDALFNLTDGLRAHPEVKSVLTIELTPMGSVLQETSARSGEASSPYILTNSCASSPLGNGFTECFWTDDTFRGWQSQHGSGSIGSVEALSAWGF